jgi:hypothetical protein
MSPGSDADPDAARDDDSFNADITEEAGPAIVGVGPEPECREEGEDEDEARTRAKHCRALLRSLFRAPFLLALHFLECRRRLGRQSLELSFYLLELYRPVFSHAITPRRKISLIF